MIERGKDGLEMSCDNCGDGTTASTSSFLAAIDELKEEGWIIKSINGDFHHFCGQSCLYEFNKKHR